MPANRMFLPTRRDDSRVDSDDDINVLGLIKGVERFVFFYTDGQRAELLRTMGRYASDPELNFTWHDAAVLSTKIGNR